MLHPGNSRSDGAQTMRCAPRVCQLCQPLSIAKSLDVCEISLRGVNAVIHVNDRDKTALNAQTIFG
jgi:hypothetical protein